MTTRDFTTTIWVKRRRNLQITSQSSLVNSDYGKCQWL